MQKNYTMSLKYLNKGYSLDPNNKLIVFSLCVVNYFAKNFPIAINFGNRYLREFGDNADIKKYIANSQNNSATSTGGLQKL